MRNPYCSPVPQREFGFAAETFILYAESAIDGERVTREYAEAETARAEFKAAQPSLFDAPRKPLRLALPYRLRAGDVITFEGKACPVIRVSDCAAVVEVARPSRVFTTIFGKTVRFQPKPRLVRISSNSAVPILSRGNGGAV